MELASRSTSVATRRPSFRVYPSKLPIGRMSNWCSKKSSDSRGVGLWKNINSYQEAFFLACILQNFPWV
uniref:Putative ovule protein n=1 Tax=Solanum chacoense TaxID=4108 RepID=A0A0V0HLG1_SOLCH